MKRYRKVMGLAIVLVALAVAINALAFKSATVTSAASFSIKASNDAAVAIDESGTPGTGVGVNIVAGQAVVTILDGMQPNSKYVFKNVFQIVHKANSTNVITIGTPEVDITDPAVTFHLFKGGTGGLDVNGDPTGTTIAGETLDNSGDSLDVDIVVVVGAAAAVADNKPGTIVINATQAE